MSGREGRGLPEDRDDGRGSDREIEEENGLVAVEDGTRVTSIRKRRERHGR